MENLKELTRRVEKIEARNRNVEADKAWETSGMRKALVAVFTYLAIAGYMKFVLQINPWINAIVPTVGFLLSTLTLPYFKAVWKRFWYKQE